MEIFSNYRKVQRTKYEIIVYGNFESWNEV